MTGTVPVTLGLPGDSPVSWATCHGTTTNALNRHSRTISRDLESDHATAQSFRLGRQRYPTCLNPLKSSFDEQWSRAASNLLGIQTHIASRAAYALEKIPNILGTLRIFPTCLLCHNLEASRAPDPITSRPYHVYLDRYLLPKTPSVLTNAIYHLNLIHPTSFVQTSTWEALETVPRNAPSVWPTLVVEAPR
jgi:hypothetical protein